MTNQRAYAGWQHSELVAECEKLNKKLTTAANLMETQRQMLAEKSMEIARLRRIIARVDDEPEDSNSNSVSG